MSLKNSKLCSFSLNLEKFTPDRNFYTGTARGARDKYEVWAGASDLALWSHFWEILR